MLAGHRACYLLVKAALVLGLTGLPAAAQGTYDEQPLRGNVADLPFANTSLGREQVRFAGNEVNRYRIYDYYKRQAQWHLGNPSDTAPLLLPFTGLDGGRRGHWGVTNELSAQALKRSVPPLIPEVLARGAYGLHYLSFPDAGGVVVYDIRLPGVRQVFSGATLTSPPGPFRGEVDCWGFSIRVQGKEWAAADQPEWSLREGEARFLGYHVRTGAVAYRHKAGDGEILEQVHLTGKAEQSVLIRQFAFEGRIPELRFTPMGAGRGTLTPAGDYLFIADRGGQAHRVSFSGEWPTAPAFDGKALMIRDPGAGALLKVSTWASTAPGQDLPRVRQLPGPDPRGTAAGGKPRYPLLLTTRGVPDADPAAAGTAYPIDDITVPFDNPWHAPMTFTGIDFDARGAAYLCTIVGDVWRVEGLDGGLGQVTWRRYASGLNLPMGLVVVDGMPYVSCRRQVMKLQDRDGDGEADYYEAFTRKEIPLGAENGGDLRRDGSGNFYTNGSRGILRISPDGTEITAVGAGSRNPLGLAVRQDGLVLSDSSEGDGGNGTCTIFESDHPENAGTISLKKRILYVPRGLDASPGSRIFPEDDRFGPLGHAILGLSYSNGSWYRILRDENEGTPQAAMIVMPGAFASGTMRLARNPADGCIYTVGMDGWGDYAVQEGCFHRIRYTGRKSLLAVDWQAHRNGMLVKFNDKVDPARLKGEAFFAQQWNTVDYRTTYGSAEYSVRHPETIGHDRLGIGGVSVQPDGSSVFFAMPDLRPAMFTQIYGRVPGTDGVACELDLYATINRLRRDFPGAPPAPDPDKPMALTVRQEEQRGNTYEVLMDFFDKAAGRNPQQRPVAGAALGPGIPDYPIVKSGIIDRYCIACHQAGTPHDLSTYDNLKTKMVPGNARKSHLIGLLKTRTMPPYPLPALHPSDVAALERWVDAGAPRGP
jgi:hypothetical protein